MQSGYLCEDMSAKEDGFIVRPISQAAVHEKSHCLCAPTFELHEHMQSNHSYTATHTETCT